MIQITFVLLTGCRRQRDLEKKHRGVGKQRPNGPQLDHVFFGQRFVHDRVNDNGDDVGSAFAELVLNAIGIVVSRVEERRRDDELAAVFEQRMIERDLEARGSFGDIGVGRLG